MNRLLSTKGQGTGIITSVATVAGALFLVIVIMVMTTETRGAIDDGCVNSTGSSQTDDATILDDHLTTNCTYSTARGVALNVMEGTEDASDMGGLLMLMVILGAVFTVALGAFLIRR